jgi:hypothetical protein
MLSKKEKARVAQALNSSPLGIFDGPGNENKLAHLKVLNEDVSQQLERFPVFAQEVFMAFMCGDKKLAKSFLGIDQQGVLNIAQLTKESLKNPEVLGTATFRLVFGASEEMSVRALAYCVPVLQLMDNLHTVLKKNPMHSSNITLPKVEFIFMSKMGSLTNKLNENKVEKQTRFLIRLIQDYCEQFHPEIIEHICFADDATFTPSLIEHPSFTEFADRLSDVADPNSELAQKLTEMGRAFDNSDLQNSLQYAGVHPFVHDGIVDPQIGMFRHLAGADLSTNTRYLFSVGAQPEIVFHQLRMQGMDLMPEDIFCQTPTGQYILKIEKAPYLPFKDGGDLLLKDVIENPHLLFGASEHDTQKKGLYHTPVTLAVQTLMRDISSEKMVGMMSLREFFESQKKGMYD